MSYIFSHHVDQTAILRVRKRKKNSFSRKLVWNGKCWAKWKYIIATRKTENMDFCTAFILVYASLFFYPLSISIQKKCVMEKSLPNEFVFRVLGRKVDILVWTERAMMNLSLNPFSLKFSYWQSYNHNIASSNNVPTWKWTWTLFIRSSCTEMKADEETEE